MNDQPKQGGGGCAKGCLAFAIAGVALALIIGVGCWFLYGKMVDRFTSAQPVEIRIDPPTEAQYQEAETALNRLREAIANNAEATVEFTAADVNALIARHPDFAAASGRLRAAFADSTVIIELSLPLDELPLPKLKGRWFNGRVKFGFSYGLSQFSFEVQSAETGGYRFPKSFLQGLGASFSSSFNTGFRKSLGENPDGTRFWSHIRRIEVQGDRLVLTTQIAGGT